MLKANKHNLFDDHSMDDPNEWDSTDYPERDEWTGKLGRLFSDHERVFFWSIVGTSCIIVATHLILYS